MKTTRFIFSALFLAAVSAAQTAPATATAKGIGPAPGAIVCRDLATVSAMVDLYASSLEERMQAVATGGGSSAVNGSPLAPPDLAHYGCALAKPGTELTLETSDQAAAVVSFRLPNGHTFKGVTQTNMIAPRDQR